MDKFIYITISNIPPFALAGLLFVSIRRGAHAFKKDW